MKPYGGFWEKSDIDFYREIHVDRIEHHNRFVGWFERFLLNEVHSVMEIGCGYGVFYPEYFFNHGIKYIGVDLAAQAIVHCATTLPGTYIVADVTCMNYPFADLVFSQGTIDNTPDMDAFLLAHLGLSKKWIYVSAYRGFYHKLKAHVYRYNREHECYYNDLSPWQARKTLLESGCDEVATWPSKGEIIIMGRK